MGLVLYSCNNEDFDVPVNNGSSVSKKIDFTYQGKSYTSTYQQVNDSVIVLEDSKVNKLYQDLMSLPDLAIYYNEDGRMSFFDDFKSLQADLKNKRNTYSPNTAKTAGYSGEIYLYEHAGAGGSYLKFVVEENGLYIPDLGIPYNFNDRMSSFSISTNASYRYTVNIFRDPHYGGRSISFAVPQGLFINNLRDYRMSSSGSWNDQASSLSVTVN